MSLLHCDVKIAVSATDTAEPWDESLPLADLDNEVRAFLTAELRHYFYANEDLADSVTIDVQVTHSLVEPAEAAA